MPCLVLVRYGKNFSRTCVEVAVSRHLRSYLSLGTSDDQKQTHVVLLELTVALPAIDFVISKLYRLLILFVPHRLNIRGHIKNPCKSKCTP